MSTVRFAVCRECGLRQVLPLPVERAAVRCARCGAVLFRQRPGGLDAALAYAVTAAIVLVIANGSSLVTLRAQGDQTSTTLLATVASLYAQHLSALAALVLGTTFVMPFLEIGLLVYVLARVRLEQRPAVPRGILLVLEAVRPWSMIEVFVLGAGTALARLAGVAQVELGWGLWAFLALAIVSTKMRASFDVRVLGECAA